MTREQFAVRIHWNKFIWFAGLVNVVAMLPQLISILATKETSGISTLMFWIFFFVQVSFAFEGYFKRNKVLMWSLGLSALESATIISAVYYFRA